MHTELCSTFPNDMEHADLLVKVIMSVGDWPIANGRASHVQNFLQPCYNVSVALASYKALGAELADQRANDPDRTHIQTLCRALASQEELATSSYNVAPPDCEAFTAACVAVAVGQQHRALVQTAELAQDVAAVDAILNSVAPFARGDVEHGNDWSARLPVDATWDDVNKLAPTTILCRPPSEYRMQAEKLEAAIETANDTSAIFSCPHLQALRSLSKQPQTYGSPMRKVYSSAFSNRLAPMIKPRIARKRYTK
jgi:hypothetical protein